MNAKLHIMQIVLIVVICLVAVVFGLRQTGLAAAGITLTIDDSHSHTSLDAADGDPAKAVYVDDTGKVGIGTTSPQSQVDIRLSTDNPRGLGFIVRATNDHEARLGIASNSLASISFISQDGKLSGTGTQAGDNGILYDWRTRKLIFNNNSEKRIVIDQKGRVGINVDAPDARLHIFEDVSDEWAAEIINQKGAGKGLLIRAAYETSSTPVLGVYDQSDKNPRFIVQANGKVGVNTDNPQTNLDVNGTTRTDVLQIDGGADLAEPFEITGVETIEPGMVVAIDPNHPGQLRLATMAYDRTVAGIISGAGGLQPGLTMHQGGFHDKQALPVALTGRVYVWANTDNGPIEPGDLLTTSNVPGHAMKVIDYERAQGATLGKAMSSLDKDTGLVLVLVALQ